MTNLILLSGPSCVGKTTLYHMFCRLYTEKAENMEKVILYNDRMQRPGEVEGVDYFFRSREEVEDLSRQDGYLGIPVRKDLHALELDGIQRILNGGRHAFYEGATYVVSALLRQKIAERIPTKTIFMSPLSRDEILFLRDPARHVSLPAMMTDIMRKKQLRRKHKQMDWLSAPDLEDIEIRCRAVYAEMLEAHNYEYVIVNHDGEDSENWTAFPYPVGDALQSVWDFVSILDELPRHRVEKWEKDLLPMP
ncbi:MAG: hypothetical protein JXR73_20385 [Candidatus Omnitrophica bacterium]|nr:hypothetical protein [Candidatus Omnitrophota bacterium]